MNRQLAAIMFADMVGYTALMQEDEAQAKESRDRNRERLIARVEEHNGRILQFYGDGALSTFQSAIQAVNAGIALQEDLRAHPPIPVRIGIHTGDIIYDEEGVFGDGVNLAARVQGLAVPGGILISEKVFDDVKNQKDIGTRSMGSFALKNVKRPMEIWAITNEGLAVPDPKKMGSRPSQCRTSVAVLPFANMSSDPENEYFSDGITEEIIDALSRIHGLQVTARTSSFAFKGKNQDIRSIAEELGVSTVLEGSVRRAGDRVRITAQLINAVDGYHLFSKSYDRDLLDIFKTQDEIARTIAAELEGRFDSGSIHRLEEGSDEPPVVSRSLPELEPRKAQGMGPVGRHIHNTEAYTEFLKGTHQFNQWTPEGVRRAIRHFEHSLELDPGCGLPYAGLATSYTFLAALGQMSGHIAYPRAREAAQKGLELEEGSAESHAAMATVLFFYDWDFQGAYRHFQKALTLAPGAAHIRRLYALFLKAMGELKTAEEELHWAVQMDPLSSTIRTGLGEVLLHGQRFEEAEDQLRRVLDLDPGHRSAREVLGWSLCARGEFAEALREFEEICNRTRDPFKVIPNRMWALMGLGLEEDARRLFHLLEERRDREPEVSLEADFALAHFALGNQEEGLDFLEAAVEQRLGMVVFMNSDLLWGKLRSNPRFQALVRRVGLPDSDQGNP